MNAENNVYDKSDNYCATKSGLIKEFPTYIQDCESQDYSGLEFKDKANIIDRFWEKRIKLPDWTKFLGILSLFQPPSAAVERVFSQLKLILSRPGMEDSLDD